MAIKFVVVGASAASMAFMTKLRSLDATCEIVCISGEPVMPYNRCFLADRLSGDTSWNDMLLKPEVFFKDHDIALRLGTWVTKIDAVQKMVWVGSEPICYDYLFLGIGTKPHTPSIPMQGVVDRVFTFHTAGDIATISEFIDTHKPRHMVVIGSGLNGLEAAAALHARGVKVTIIERAEQILSSQVDTTVAQWIAKIFVEQKVTLLLQRTVVTMTKDQSNRLVLTLDNEQKVYTDGVIGATGSVCHSELLENTDIVLQQGAIVVNEAMKTSNDFVYAGGDICMVRDMVSKQLVKSSTWSDAMLQGLCAATQFGKQPRSYPGAIGLRDSSWFGYDFYACGMTINHDGSYQLLSNITGQTVKRLYVKDGVLKGFVLLGDTSCVGQYKQWYMAQLPIENNVEQKTG